MDSAQMMEKDADDAFLSEFRKHLPSDSATLWTNARRQLSGRTKASYHMRNRSTDLRFEDVPDLLLDAAETSIAVVVEAVDMAWMLQLGRHWNIAPSFFAEHAIDVARNASNPWNTILPGAREDLSKPQAKPIDTALLNVGTQDWSDAYVWHIDGCLTPARDANGTREDSFNPIQRQLSTDVMHAANTSTRISSWDSRSPNKLSFMLFLVDGPYLLKPEAGIRPFAELHIPLSRNRGGLVIPQLSSQPTFRLLESLQSFLSHGWHFNALFASRGRVSAIGPDTFAYLLAASHWETNLRHADKQIKHISFEELREPSTAINNRLHNLRRDLDYIRSGVFLALEWMPGSAQRPLRHLVVEFAEVIVLPKESLTSTEKRASELQKFLMDTFTLLLSSISVREAELGVQQSIRAQRLTTLAFIYVPLSFVTGIYGMNIAELNGSPLSIWVPVVTLAGTILVTAAVFASYARWQRGRASRPAERPAKEGQA